jgi:hypothetical protein
MKFRRKFGGRGVPAAAALVLFCCTSIAMLLAPASSAPTQPNSSAAKFSEAAAYANTKLISARNRIAVNAVQQSSLNKK